MMIQKKLAYRFPVYLFALLILFTACSDDEDVNPKPPSNSINKIMPLGASRVEGASPSFESFRYELWKLLIDGGFTFDYIGTQNDNSNYPDFSGSSFDVDHEGRGGWTSGQILQGIEGWINQSGAPDVVLFSSPGGNDALQNLSYTDAIANVNAIIDIIQTANPNVTIVIEQMAPARSDVMTTTLNTYFTQMQEDVLEIAAQQSTATSRVIAVDMFTGFDDSKFADEVHYNTEGAQFIANRYYTVLDTVLQE